MKRVQKYSRIISKYFDKCLQLGAFEINLQFGISIHKHEDISVEDANNGSLHRNKPAHHPEWNEIEQALMESICPETKQPK